MNPYTPPETQPTPAPVTMDPINAAMLLANIVMMVVQIKTFLGY